jgi:hypothetical protein
MFPLAKRKLIRGFQAHIKAGLGGAADYEANYIPFDIPFDGTVQTYYGPEGGNWLRLIRDDNGDKIELAHLSKYAIKSGHAKAGQLGGTTGNTGSITDYPHLHIQILRNGKRLDPESYSWESTPPTPMPIKYPITLVTTQAWTAAQVEEARQMILGASDNRLDVQVTIVQKLFPQIPFTNNLVDPKWYKDNVLPARMLHMSIAEWKSTEQGWTTEDGIQFRADENESDYYSGSGITVKGFVQNFVHELCHWLFRQTGQPDITHQYMFVPQGLFNPKGAYSQLDYSQLTNTPMAQIITQGKGPERRIVLKAADLNEWQVLCRVYGKDPNKVEETV